MHRLFTLFAVMLLVAGFTFAQAPTYSSVDDDTVFVGSSYSLMIYGGSFLPGIASDFGPDITVTGTLRLSASLARADIIVEPTAALGVRDIYIYNVSGEGDTLFDSFWVLPEGDPPDVTLLWPNCGDTTSCNDSSITILIEDGSGIDASTIQLRVGGVVYTTANPELTFTPDLLRWTPVGPFPEGVIDISLIDVADIFGNHIPGPAFDCTFIMDTTGPEFDYIFPPPFGSTRDFSPVIYFMAFDDLTDFDTTSLFFVVDGDTFFWGDAPVRFRNDTVFFYSNYAGLEYELHDTIYVTIGAYDLVGGPCGSNFSDYDFYFSIEVPPPEDLSLDIESINPANFPLISSYCIVNDEEDRMIEGLDERNFRVWTNGIEQYPLIVQSLGGGGAADIVWCIDTTGSMSRLIDTVAVRCTEFATALAASGIDYRLGLVTFSDIVNFPYGYDLTGDVTEFYGWMSVLGSSGGGDGPEVHFDAIVDALEEMHWRPGAKKVICLVSDAPYHYIGDGTAYSDETYDDVYSAIMSNDAIAFVILDTSYTDASRPYNGVYFGPGSITEETGGGFYLASTNFDTILANIVENIRGGYYVRWSTSHPVASCDFREVEIEARQDEWDLEDDDEFQYWAPCSPEAIIVEPHPDTISTQPYPTSNDTLQAIIMDLTEIELEDSVDEDRLQLIVNGTIYTIADAQLDFSSSILTFTPQFSWAHGEWVNVILARVMDSQGNLPFSGPLRWVWREDREPPEISEKTPAPDAVVYDHYAPVSCKIFDDLSGVNDESIILTYQNREARETLPPEIRFLDINTAGVTWDGTIFEFDPALANPPLNNADNDSICVSVARAMDQPDYVELNTGANAIIEDKWCFRVPDDDSLCPEFEFVGPFTVESGENFQVTMVIIDDLSGVYDPVDPADPYGVILVYDLDGDLSDGYLGEMALSRTFGDTFVTDDFFSISDLDAFIFAVYACDNDTDGGYEDDRSCCWSDTFRISKGPITVVEYPKHNEVTTNEDQRIAVFIVDSADGVDETSIVFGVDGIDFTTSDPALSYVGDTMFYDPQVGNYFTDGMWVACSLKHVEDNQGAEGEPRYWHFFVDLTPPRVANPAPANGAVVIELDIDITADLWDAHRDVEETTIVITFNDTLSFIWGDPGMHYDPSGEIFLFSPDEAGFLWRNNDSVCVDLIAADVMPDYGEFNMREPFHWCFFPSVTSCNYYPNPITPNGDGINDIAYFTYPYMALGHGIIRIYDIDNEVVYVSPEGADTWNGTVNSGGIGAPGLYLFTIEIEGENVCSGSILLLR